MAILDALAAHNSYSVTTTLVSLVVVVIIFAISGRR
jgi:hypothetical protein